MGFAEALSDDGSLTGRGKPLVRGTNLRVMTTAGGIGHTLPYLIPDFRLATGIAIAVVAVELGGHQLDTASLHGHPDCSSDAAGCPGRSVGVFRRTADREIVDSRGSRHAPG